MTDTAFFEDGINPSDADKKEALNKLHEAVVEALNYLKTTAKDKAERLSDWLEKNGTAWVEEFKTAEGMSWLLISTGVGLFVASLTFNIIVAVGVQHTLIAMTAAAAGFICGLISMGAGAVLSALAGISAIGIVPLGIGISGSALLTSLGGVAGFVAGVKAMLAAAGGGSLLGALGLGVKMTVGGKICALTMAAIGITSTPVMAPAAAIGVGLFAAGATLWGFKKYADRRRSKKQSK